MYLIGVVVFVLLGVMKWTFLQRTVQRVSSGVSAWALMADLQGAPLMYALLIPVGLTMLFLVVYALVQGHTAFIPAIGALGIGIIFNAYGTVFRAPQLFAGGATGCLLRALVRRSSRGVCRRLSWLPVCLV